MKCNMKRKRVVLLASTILFALLSVSSAAGQNLIKDNKYYKEAQELRQQAEAAFEAGEYQKATELSQKAKELSSKAGSFAETQVHIYKARNWNSRAEDFIRWGKGIRAEERYPEKWKEANTSYTEAQSLLEEEKWDESIKAARMTISIIQTMEAPSPAKPKYYVVRLIPERRDCFWRIAGYEFVYDNPWKWKRLYEANKEKLPEPGNPDLIEPGIKLEIPSISGERRGGTWKESK